MPLPFTAREFFDLFGAYNRSFWPDRRLLDRQRGDDGAAPAHGVVGSQGLTRLVALQWAWTAVA